MNSQSFYITLPSSSHSLLYKDNTLARYTTTLDRIIDLENVKYEVGLCEISLECNIFNVEENEIGFTLIRNFKDIENSLPPSKNISGEIWPDYDGSMALAETMYLYSGVYEGINEILEGLNERLKHSKFGNDLYFSEVTLKPNKDKYFHASKYISLKPRSRSHGKPANNMNCTIAPSEILGRILSTADDLVKSLDLGVGVFFKLNHRNIPHPTQLAFVYSNIVQHQIMGDTQGKLLRVSNLNIKPNEHTSTIVYNTPHYVPVCLQEISEIKIDMRTVEGKIFPFSEGQLLVKLHFRQLA